MSDAFSFEASVYWSTSTAGGPIFVHMLDDSIKIEAAKAKSKISRLFGLLLKRDGEA